MNKTQATPGLPKPDIGERRLVQAEIDQELFKAVEKEMKPLGLKIRQVIDFGFRAFLLKANPRIAAKLGIKAE